MAEWSGEDGVGDSIYVEWKNNGGTVRVDCFNATAKVSSSGELRGDPRDLEGRLSAVFGAHGLFDAIKASFEEGMTKEKCRDLVGVAPGSSNVNEFLSSKVKAAENLIAQSDTKAKR
ncbi:hypothetical protein Pmar_PMAR000653 [Perkinsus marinus ATCC 50983]|uniref:Uncharacterized protein n=1 Tax=Perkinsus marinus (strain ATCC 50983 / TXsc) TaxID=423536 RepID=C5KRE6_PERM5|nr:hypothetical protein Pmar_PMAR000653 [Perkinsus marinus ATCC 50983]EER12919.1 hypothetical protein Pmar_PMAR000653 [Perkinsus marinus ATCC 50983]|eukprot:XP_002781124.1 hypothetical protein Pmar_PMAR000653 [Perkinsus marinus ATCC 50983]